MMLASFLLCLAVQLAYDPSIGPSGVGDLSVPPRVTEETPAALVIHGGGWAGMGRRDVAGIAGFLRDDLGCVVCIDCRPDGTWHEYAFDLSGNKGWTGDVDELWLGVEDLMHAVVDIDWMRFESAVVPKKQNGANMNRQTERER